MSRGLSVRETEKLAKKSTTTRPSRAQPATKDADTRALESDLAAATGLAVSIDHRPDGSGSLTVRYRSLEELDDLCRRIGNA